jgi:hypothetical protein
MRWGLGVREKPRYLKATRFPPEGTYVETKVRALAQLPGERIHERRAGAESFKALPLRSYVGAAYALVW